MRLCSRSSVIFLGSLQLLRKSYGVVCRKRTRSAGVHRTESVNQHVCLLTGLRHLQAVLDVGRFVVDEVTSEDHSRSLAVALIDEAFCHV